MLLFIAKAADAVFVPAIGSAAGVIVGKIVPGVAVGAIVFAHGAPGPLAEVRAPALPIHRPGSLGDQSVSLRIVGHRSLGLLRTLGFGAQNITSLGHAPASG